MAKGLEASWVRRAVLVTSAAAARARPGPARQESRRPCARFLLRFGTPLRRPGLGKGCVGGPATSNMEDREGALLDKYLRREDERGLLEKKMREEGRLPPGQSASIKWPVLHEGDVPAFDPQTWDFRVGGLVEAPLT